MLCPTGYPLRMSLLLLALSLPSVSFADRPQGSYFAFIRAPHEIFRLARVEPDLEDDMICGKLSSGIDGRYKSKCVMDKKRLDADGKIQIKTYNKDGKTKLALKGKLEGEGKVDGKLLDTVVTFKGKGKVTPGVDTVPMNYTIEVCAKDGGDKVCDKDKLPAVIALATGDGGWSLVLRIDRPKEGKVGKKLKGTASLSFADGMVHEYALTGDYDPKEDKSKIVLEATDPKKGGSVMIKNARANLGSLSMEGKLLYDLYGHSGKIKAFFNQSTAPGAL